MRTADHREGRHDPAAGCEYRAEYGDDGILEREGSEPGGSASEDEAGEPAPRGGAGV
ncbi:MAG TPA: hypothetical protein VFW96_18850 [Thermomicrobiales bacterium]|nr:hypothetical protein [Thermomicrobiales bacterium]